MSAHTPTPAQLRLLANLRDGQPLGHGIAQAHVAAVESNCLRNGLLRLWPFPGRGRLSDAGRKALEAVLLDDTAEDALSLITAGGALFACFFLAGSLAVPFIFL